MNKGLLVMNGQLLKKAIGIITSLVFFTASFAQQKKIYLANDDHTDYMWTGDEETYKKAFSEMLDYYIKLNDSTAGLPYNQQSKWNCDGSYWVYNYRQTRSKGQFDKLIAQIKAGKITVPLNSIDLLQISNQLLRLV